MQNVSLFSIILSLGFLSFHCFSAAERPEGALSEKSIYGFSVTGIDGSIIDFSEFKGKNILIVNVASKCGFTPQYESLEKLYRDHSDELVIVGFPSNSFKQEYDSNEEIAAFCQRNFGVTFPLAELTDVRGDNRHEVFRWLTDESLNGWNSTAPQWNFYKYLIDKNGELTHVFPSNTDPLSEEILNSL